MQRKPSTLKNDIQMMFAHNLKLAVRQLLKYRQQTLLSLLGLAVGFTCFALSSLWWRYETTYDDFHPEVENLYTVLRSSDGRNTVEPYVPFLFATEAMKRAPEVELATSFFRHESRTAEKTKLRTHVVDTAFLRIFQPELVAGSYPKMQPNGKEVVITDQTARRLFGGTDCTGRQIALKGLYEEEFATIDGEYTVAAVVKDWGGHTAYSFDCLTAFTAENIEWHAQNRHRQVVYAFNTVFRLYPGASPDSIAPKVTPHLVAGGLGAGDYWLTPLASLRTDWPNNTEWQPNVRIGHVRIFALLGALVIVCALFNYLSLYIIRIRMRSRELALRTVCGASRSSLLGTLTTEFLLLLAASWLLGMVLMEWLLPYFQEVTLIKEEYTFFLRETALYLLAVALVTLPLLVGVTWWVQRKSLNETMRKGERPELPGSRHLFRRFSLLVQLSVSMGLMFATSVIVLQLHHLRHSTDIGFSYKNRAVVTCRLENGTNEEVHRLLLSHPDVEEVLADCAPVDRATWFKNINGTMYPVRDISREEIDFWGLRLQEGRWMYEENGKAAMPNETAADLLGLHHPSDTVIGNLKITGVVHNVSARSLILQQGPTFYNLRHKRKAKDINVLSIDYGVRYRPGSWLSVRDSLYSLFQRKGLRTYIWHTSNMEEEFNELLTSEDTLLRLFYLMTGVCVLIALFGVYSLMTITCEQRRKEIAIRKVHGATVMDILRLFFGEQAAVLLLAAAVGFPVAYLCIQPWIEGYILQVEIPLWLCPAIWGAVALLVALCIGWRVWKTANSRPADEICKG